MHQALEGLSGGFLFYSFIALFQIPEEERTYTTLTFWVLGTAAVLAILSK